MRFIELAAQRLTADAMTSAVFAQSAADEEARRDFMSEVQFCQTAAAIMEGFGSLLRCETREEARPILNRMMEEAVEYWRASTKTDQ